jgi:hypothetical protein
MSDFLNISGGVLMAISFIIMGCVGLIYSKHGDLPYRRRIAYLYSACFLLSGISRAFGVFEDWFPSLYLWDGIIKNLAGATGLLCVALIPIAIRELKRIKTLDTIDRDIQETKERLDNVKEHENKINVRNNR